MVLLAPPPPVLALDIGTRCGWALAVDDQLVASGGLDLTPRPGDHPGRRYRRLLEWLDASPALTGLGQVMPGLLLALEDVRNHGRRDAKTGRVVQGVTAAHVYGGLRAVAEAWACARGVSTCPIGVGAWKQSLGLSGGSHASKEAVFAQVVALGYAPRSQDEADAIGIALHAHRLARWRGLGEQQSRGQTWDTTTRSTRRAGSKRAKQRPGRP